MAAPTVRQIRAGVADRLDTIAGLNTFSYLPGQFTPPAAVVLMPTRMQQETLGSGTLRWELTVWVIVARQLDSHSEKALEGYLDPTGDKSVRAAIAGDTTLGGLIGKNQIFETRAEPADLVFGTGQNERRFLGLEFTYMILSAGKD